MKFFKRKYLAEQLLSILRLLEELSRNETKQALFSLDLRKPSKEKKSI